MRMFLRKWWPLPLALYFVAMLFGNGQLRGQEFPFVYLPFGTNPQIAIIGDIAQDQTDNQLVIWDETAGAAIAFDRRRFQAIVVEDPVDADNFVLLKAFENLTITDVHCIVDPAGTGESIDIDIEEADGSADSGVDIDATAITCSNTGAEDDGSISDPNIDAGDWVLLDVVSAPTGTVSQLSVTVYYTIDRT